MNVIVFGATGRAGSQILKRALEKGHRVTAFVRDPAKVTLLHPNLTTMRGDALSQESVSAAMRGQEVVINALSAADNSQRQVFIHHLINAMRERHVKRIVALGGIGALQASEHLKVYETTTFPKEYVEVTQAHIRVLDALLTSGLDFTFVCPPVITEGERTGQYKTQENYPTQGWTISAGDLADFVVVEAEAGNYLRKKVGISNG